MKVHNSLPRIYLASASPRRFQLLKGLGIDFSVYRPRVAESDGQGKSAPVTALSNARHKAAWVLKRLKGSRIVVLGADTVVALRGEILGKPHSLQEARAILRKLSGRTHEVVTGLVLLSPEYGTRERCVRSKVTFRRLSRLEIDHYAKTEEPYDKAGAYGIQGLGSLFVSKVSGSYTNVMGLPVDDLLRELEALTRVAVYRWFE